MSKLARALVLGVLLPWAMPACSSDEAAGSDGTQLAPDATVTAMQTEGSSPVMPSPAGPASASSSATGPDAPSAPNSGSPAPTLEPDSSLPSAPTLMQPTATGMLPVPASGGAGSGFGGSNTGGDGVNTNAGMGGTVAQGGAAVGGAAVGGTGPLGGQANTGGATATEPSVQFIGRFRDDGDAGVRFGWSGSGIIAAFEGTSVSVTLEDSGSNQFTVLIDGELQETLLMQAGSQSYELATGLVAGPHQVELYRRTEASFGVTTFHGFEFGTGGVLLPPPARKPRRIEIIGDSISCGYGNEGASATCGFSADTENHYLTYGALAARAVDAEVTTIAWSGKGIVYNYDTDTNEPLPDLYDRSLPMEAASVWGFAEAPDVVVINLGTNDYSTEGDPTEELFSGRYVTLLEHLREVYPAALILCTVGPLLSGADLDATRAGIESAVGARQQAGDNAVVHWEMNVANNNPGCDYHPGLLTHQAMADALLAELSTRLGW